MPSPRCDASITVILKKVKLSLHISHVSEIRTLLYQNFEVIDEKFLFLNYQYFFET